MIPPLEAGVVRSSPDTSSEHALAAACSALCYHVSEDVSILTVIMAIRKLRQVQWQIGFADIVKRADHATLQQAPKAIKVRGMNVPAHVFPLHMIHRLMWELALQSTITVGLIGGDQRDAFTHRLPNKVAQRHTIGALNDLADYIALASDSTDHPYFTATDPWLVSALAPMAVLVLASDIGFIHFDFAHELGKSSVLHRRTNAVAHIPSRSIVPTPDLAMDLQSADSLFALRHQVDDLKPSSERIVGIFKHGLADHGEPIAVPSATLFRLADPMKRLGLQLVDFFILTARTLHAVRPTLFCEELLARFFSREAIHQVGNGHRGLGHGVLCCWEDYTHKVDVVSSTT
jgi:hypothetical protein